jgi:regulator of RNase E activity RraB
MQNGTTAKAYYDEKGELFGISRHIMQEDLALNIKRALAKLYNGYTVKEAIKFEGGEGTAYFLVAENDKYKSVLKVVDGQLSLYKKELKSK